jgi:alcohol dehydrogenase
MTTTTSRRPTVSPIGAARVDELHLPPIVHFGRGALARLGREARGFGERALVVTDRGLATSDIVRQAVEVLRDAGVDPIVFDRVEPNPTVAQVEDGLAAGADRQVAIVVSVGGGSAHDCAKVIALVAANGGEVREYEGSDRSRHRGLPLICVNTTAGSGAEVSRYAVITDPFRELKMIVADRHLMPRVAIDDPLLTVGLPAPVTVASGLDALTHAIEAYVSTSASELTDLHALRAIELIAATLETAVRTPTDVNAREAMLMGAFLAGLAIDSASVGAVHAMAHQVGAVYDAPHGVCNGLLLPAVVEANLPAARERYDRVAAAMGAGPSGQRLPAALKALGERLGLPRGLGALGVERSRIGALAARAMTDMTMATNPRQLSEADVARLFERAL